MAEPTHPRSAPQSGFTLLELSIFLVVVAVLAASALLTGDSQQSFAREKNTYDKMAIIEESLAGFLRLNGRLPCPARGDTVRSNSTLGQEDCAVTTVNTVGSGSAEAVIHVGIIPIAQLALSPEFLVDGWDRRFTYAVEARFVDRNRFGAAIEDLTPTPTDSFIRVANGLDPTRLRTRWAVYVLMSAGEDGGGSWPRNGGARLSMGSVTDIGQLDNNVFTDKRFTQTMRTSGFNDIVHYRRRAELTAEAGSVFSGRQERTLTAPVPTDDCTLARLTLLPINNPNATVTDNRALEGAIGCEDEAVIRVVSPGLMGIGTNADIVMPIPPEPAYRGMARVDSCISRQLRLAEAVHARCLH